MNFEFLVISPITNKTMDGMDKMDGVDRVDENLVRSRNGNPFHAVISSS